MALKRAKPSPVARQRASGSIIAGAIDGPEHTPQTFALQVLRLQRRFRLAEPVARTIAEIAFGWRAAA
jgi:hypothetical protein